MLAAAPMPSLFSARPLEYEADQLAFQLERAPQSPEEALSGLVVASQAGLCQATVSRCAMALVSRPNSRIAALFLRHAARAQRAGVEMRMILAEPRRWGWWRAEPTAAAIDILGPQRLRLLRSGDARRYYEQAVFGLDAHWSGDRISSWRLPGAQGRFIAHAPSIAGRRQAALAHTSFEAVWSIARPI
ncbi:MAG: hypothetical protein MRY74_15110 [Neomegalonema sp.]|nr:hypothetical protein [Neomegalonema sp.]